jgi:hypothetical protein
MSWVGKNQTVAQTLMIALAVVMGHEILNRCPQGAFAKQDQPFQTGFLDAAYKAFGVGVGMSPQMRRMATLKVDVSE